MKLIWKLILGIVIFIVLSLVMITWYYSHNWRPIVEAKLQEVVHNSTDGLYSLRYEDLDLNIGLGNATLSRAELIPDTAVYQQMISQKTAPNNRYHIKIKALKVRRFSLMDVLSSKKLNIKTIVFDEPEVHLISEYHAFNDSIAEKPSKTLYESIKDIFTSINVKDIQIDDIRFKYSKIEEGKSSDINLDKINIKVHDVLVDETALTDTTRLFYTKMVDVQIPSFEYELPDGFYKAKFKDLRVNTRDQNVLFTKVEYRPTMKKSAFFKQKKQNVTMAILKFDTLRFEKMDFKRFIEDQQTIAAKVQMKNGSMDLSNDKRYPKDPVNKIGHSPHQELMRLKKLLRIDTLLVDNVSVTYHEYSAKYNKEGTISFDHVRGVLTNVTNDTARLEKEKYMRADLRAKIMDEGALHIQFGFDMLSSEGFHIYRGTLGSMRATAFNRILRPLLNVEIASGNIHKIAFNMEGNDYKNWGEFRFDYDELKVNLLNKPEAGEEKKAKKLVSFLVNEIIINNSNPEPNGNYNIGKVNYTRIAEYSFFKTLWQSMLDGIKQCAGISPEREAKLMGTANTAQNVVKGTKKVIQKTGKFFKNIFKKKDKDSEKEEDKDKEKKNKSKEGIDEKNKDVKTEILENDSAESKK